MCMYRHDKTLFLEKQWNDKHKNQKDTTSVRETKYLAAREDSGIFAGVGRLRYVYYVIKQVKALRAHSIKIGA